MKSPPINVEPKTKEFQKWYNENPNCLHVAIKANNVFLVEYLIASGANVNSKRGKRKQTPLHIAAHYSHNFIPLLIASGADPMRTNKAGLTPMHTLLMCKDHEKTLHLKHVVELAKGGVDIWKESPLGTIFELACHYPTIAEFLVKNYHKP